LFSGQRWRLWADQFRSAPPFPTGPDVLVVAYYASAELGCYRVLNWPMPERTLDLFTEFRDRTNGLETPSGSSLLGALTYFGLDSIGADEKQGMRDLVLRGGPWSSQEQEAIVEYCESDVTALGRLLPAMLPRIDLPRALLRGRYMGAAAIMEHTGVPIDMPTLELLREHRLGIQDELIAAIDADYGVYEGRTFKADRWEQFLARHNIPWQRTETGALCLTDDVFRQAAKTYPIVSPIRELRSALSELRLADLAVGADGRNRTILSAFRSRTGRNQPSSSRYIFGNAVWLRGLIKPAPGYGIAYLDYSQQEFGIAAALSGDRAMQEAYRSGDPYLAFAKQAGAVPPDATKETHGQTRELFKTCALGVLYGMAEAALAMRIGQSVIVARDLLRAHHETYRRFWEWSDAAVDFAMLTGALHTSLGWHVHVGGNVNPRSLRNFPMQANGAEILRLACCLATEGGIEVCGPVHDALLICAPLERLEAEILEDQEGDPGHRAGHANPGGDLRRQIRGRRVQRLPAAIERHRFHRCRDRRAGGHLAEQWRPP
jgi:DNA polymerase I